MQQVSFAAAALGIGIAFAAPAQADIIMIDASKIQGQNILFNKDDQTAALVNGFTNSNPALSVDITSGGAIVFANGGQARVEGNLDTSTENKNDRVNLTQFELDLTSGGTFNELELRLFQGQGSTATTASFTLIDNAGDEFTFNNQALVGDARFGFRGIKGQTIRSVAFTVNGNGIADVRQIRLDPATPTEAIPEPATWAMMIGGFGMLGAAARRRPRMAVSPT
jgi:hypothetical protein